MLRDIPPLTSFLDCTYPPCLCQYWQMVVECGMKGDPRQYAPSLMRNKHEPLTFWHFPCGCTLEASVVPPTSEIRSNNFTAKSKILILVVVGSSATCGRGDLQYIAAGKLLLRESFWTKHWHQAIWSLATGINKHQMKHISAFLNLPLVLSARILKKRHGPTTRVLIVLCTRVRQLFVNGTQAVERILLCRPFIFIWTLWQYIWARFQNLVFSESWKKHYHAKGSRPESFCSKGLL